MNKDMTGKVYNKLDITHVEGITVKAETFYRGTIDDLYIYFGYREYVTTAGWNGDWFWGVPVIVYNTVIYEYIVKCYRVSPGIYTIVSSKPSNFDGRFVSDHNYIYCPNTLISDNKAGVWEKNFSLKYSAYLDAVYQTSLSVAATHEFKLL